MEYADMTYAAFAAAFAVGYLACMQVNYIRAKNLAELEHNVRSRERKLSIAGDIVGGMLASANRGVEFNVAHVINILERIQGILRG